MRVLVLSDIHLGHANNKTEFILFNIRKMFLKYKKDILKTDMILITGDVFDKLLSITDVDMVLTYEWLTELVLFCRDYNIVLRVLEGTPSHDWKQMSVIYKIIKNLKLDIDFKYIDTLFIEHVKRFDKYMLFIPDEWRHDPLQTFKEVKELLKENKIEKVDITAMHGAFNFQLPEFIDGLHDEQSYLDITDGPIVVGHVHDRMQYKRIIVPGSVDRLTHSDGNKDKGFLLLDVEDNNKYTFKYLDNPNPLDFITISKVRNINDLDKKLSKIKHDKLKFIRIDTEDDEIKSNILEIKKKYNLFKITFNSKKKDKKKKDIVFIKKANIILDNNTITSYVKDRIENDNINDTLAINIIKKLGGMMNELIR